MFSIQKMALCLSAPVLAFSFLAQAQESSELIYSVDPELNQHVEMMVQAREEQNQFFEALESGQPVDISGENACKYVSSISVPAPAKTVILTFDDGPNPETTPIVLDELKKRNLTATFFVTGSHASTYPQIMKRIVAEGHVVSSHSWDHPNFHTLDSQAQTNQMSGTDMVIRGVAKPYKLFRYPFGNSTCFGNNLIKSLGYTGIVGWHVDSCDWAFQAALQNGTGMLATKHAAICEVREENRPVSRYVDHVVADINRRGGGIALFHDVRSITAKNIGQIIDTLAAQGYRFKNLDSQEMKKYFR